MASLPLKLQCVQYVHRTVICLPCAHHVLRGSPNLCHGTSMGVHGRAMALTAVGCNVPPWHCHGPSWAFMALPQHSHGTDIDCHDNAMGLARDCHGSTMRLPWDTHETSHGTAMTP